MLNYNHLYYFYITGKLSSISRAAQTLNISQPSLSSQIKVLESRLKLQLFEKSGRGLKLSFEGQKVFDFCERMFEAGQDLENFLLDKSQFQVKKVRIGVSDQIERPFVADLIAEIHSEHNDKEKKLPTLSVTTGTQAALMEDLLLRKIDCFLTNIPAFNDDLIELAMVDMPVVALISKDLYASSEFRKRGATFLPTFKDSPYNLVLPAGPLKLRHETELYFQKNKIRKPIVFESDILSVVARAIVDGVGIGFLPLPFVAEELYHGLLVNIGPDQGLWWHKLYLVARKQDKQEDLLMSLRDIILSLKQEAQFYRKNRK